MRRSSRVPHSPRHRPAAPRVESSDARHACPRFGSCWLAVAHRLRCARWSSLGVQAEFANPLHPTFALLRRHRFGATDQRRTNTSKSAGRQHGALWIAAHAVIPPIRKSRHPHRDDDTRSFAFPELHGPPAQLRRAECETRTHDLLEPSFQSRRHRPEPQRMQDRHVLRPVDRVDARSKVFRRIASIVVFAAQNRHFHIRKTCTNELVSRGAGAFAIRIGKTMNEAVGRRIGVSVQYENSFCFAHGVNAMGNTRARYPNSRSR